MLQRGKYSVFLSILSLCIIGPEQVYTYKHMVLRDHLIIRY